MKIQLGQIVMNKTKKYLLPCLKAYGPEFEQYVNSVFKVGVGVGDILLAESGIHYQQHIFLLLDTARCRYQTKKFLEWLRNQVMYEDDYAFDNISTGHLQMVVIKLPEECYKAAEWFKHSQFSKMFTLSDVDRFFKDYPDTQRILVRDHSYKIEYSKQLNDTWGTDISEEEAGEIEGELDLPIRKEEETFNLLTFNDK